MDFQSVVFPQMSFDTILFESCMHSVCKRTYKHGSIDIMDTPVLNAVVVHGVLGECDLWSCEDGRLVHVVPSEQGVSRS